MLPPFRAVARAAPVLLATACLPAPLSTGAGAGGLGHAGPAGGGGAGSTTDGTPGDAGVTGTGGIGSGGGGAGAPGGGGAGGAMTSTTTCETCGGATCVDLSTDPAHCGACGHDCVGGACASGACQPVAILPDDDMPVGIAVDETDVFWASTDHGRILGCPKTGCAGSPTVIAEEQGAIYGVLVHGDDLYWVAEAKSDTQGAIRTCKKTGCEGGSPKTLVSGLNYPRWLRATTTELFWSNWDAILRCPFADCSAPTKIVDVPMSVESFAVDEKAGLLYWGNSAGLFGCALAGCAPTTLPPPDAYGVATDGARVYFIGGGGLGACKGAQCETLTGQAAGCFPNTMLVVDATSVYFAGCAPVRRCPKTGPCGAPQILSDEVSGNGDLTMDATHVYYTNYGVFRVAK